MSALIPSYFGARNFGQTVLTVSTTDFFWQRKTPYTPEFWDIQALSPTGAWVNVSPELSGSITSTVGLGFPAPTPGTIYRIVGYNYVGLLPIISVAPSTVAGLPPFVSPSQPLFWFDGTCFRWRAAATTPPNWIIQQLALSSTWVNTYPAIDGSLLATLNTNWVPLGPGAYQIIGVVIAGNGVVTTLIPATNVAVVN